MKLDAGELAGALGSHLGAISRLNRHIRPQGFMLGSLELEMDVDASGSGKLLPRNPRYRSLAPARAAFARLRVRAGIAAPD